MQFVNKIFLIFMNCLTQFTKYISQMCTLIAGYLNIDKNVNSRMEQVLMSYLIFK